MILEKVGSRKTAALALAALAAFTALYVLTASSTFTYDHDISSYLGLAKSLARGEGYVFNGRPHTQFPPGMPLLLVPFASTDTATLFRVFSAIAVAGLVISWLLVRNRGDDRALPIAAIIGLSATYYVYGTASLFSDIPYLVVSAGFLLWAEHYLRPERRKTVTNVLAGALIFLYALMLRSVSIALLGGVALTLAAQLRRRQSRFSAAEVRVLILLLLVGTAYTASWFYWAATHAFVEYDGQVGHSYLGQVVMRDPLQPDLGRATALEILLRIPGAVLMRSAQIAELFLNVPWLREDIYSPLLVGFSAFCFIGWMHDLRRWNQLAAWYLFCYLGVLLMWPFDENQRFLLPVAPLLFLYAYLGLRVGVAWAGKRTSRQLGSIGALAATGMIVLSLLSVAIVGGEGGMQRTLNIAFWVALMVAAVLLRRRGDVRLELGGMSRLLLVTYVLGYCAIGTMRVAGHVRARSQAHGMSPIHAEAQRAMQWLARELEPGDVVMSEDHAAISLFTGHRVVALPITASADVLRNALLRWTPRYVTINDPKHYSYYLPEETGRFAVMEQLFPGRFHVVHEYRGGRIYEFTAP